MWIGRICLFSYLSAYISAFFLKPTSHRNYVAFLQKKLFQTSGFLPFGKYILRKLMQKSLNSKLRNKL